MAWDKNLHAVQAVCSVACLECNGRIQVRLVILGPKNNKLLLLKPFMQKRLEGGRVVEENS